MKGLTEIRKDLHRIPELGFDEWNTQDYILDILKQHMELTIHTFDFPGIVAEYTRNEKSYKLFRSDMDALPIAEKTGCEFASTHMGKMHACGHDIHMTVLLGLIDRLMKEKPDRNYLFLFQPAEEGLGGAERILKTGLLDRFEIAEAYALHVKGGLPVNTVSTREGIFFGIPQEFDVIFRGESAHVAFPQTGRDALAAGVTFYQAMSRMMLERFPATESVVFYVGTMNAGDVRNAVPRECVMKGTTRSLSRENWKEINDLMERVAKSTAEMHDVEYEVVLHSTYDPVVNSGRLYREFLEQLPEGVQHEGAAVTMTGEDFGFFTTRYDGLLFWLGAGEAAGDLHSDRFLPDESSIETGIEVMMKMALKKMI